MVLPSASLRLLIGLSALTHQNSSLAPVISAPMMRYGVASPPFT